MQNGCPESEGRVEHNEAATAQAPSASANPAPVDGVPDWDGATIPESWRPQVMQRRAAAPLLMSPEYERAIAACVAAQQTERARKSASTALTGYSWEPRDLARVLAVLAGVAVVLWLGIKVAAASVLLFAAPL